MDLKIGLLVMQTAVNEENDASGRGLVEGTKYHSR